MYGSLLSIVLSVFSGGSPARAADVPPPIRHVFVIVMENKGYDETFGPNSKAPYFSGTLTKKGQLLSQYHGITHNSLGNYIAMVSGQGSNLLTQADCLVYASFVGGLIGNSGQAVGQGCVYPQSVKTVADQLEAKGLTWGGYMEDMATPCQHPALNSQDRTQVATKASQYAARHNPFVYFRSLIDRPTCAQHDVPLDRLPAALAKVSTTPNLSFITPDLCNDGHDAPCVDGQRPGGLASEDAFLKEWVPRILASPAYKRDGLLIVTYDEAEGSGSNGDASACCGEPQFPNTPNNGGTVIGRGGGRTGSVVLSPYIPAGTTNSTPYNHFSLLRSIEDIFGLGHLGYAGRSGLKPFGPDVYGVAPPRCGGARPTAHHGRYRRGALIGSARITRSAGRSRLALRGTRHARLRITTAGHTVGPRFLGCSTIHVRLPAGHGTVRVAARLRGSEERRTLTR